MARLIWSLLCDRPIIDAYRNSISVIDVVEVLTIQGPPLPKDGVPVVVPIEITLVSLWMRSELEKPERIAARPVIVTPDGDERFGKPIDGDLESAPRTRLIQRFTSFPLAGSGEYTIRIESRSEGEEWQRVADFPIEVRFREAPAQAAPENKPRVTAGKILKRRGK